MWDAIARFAAEIRASDFHGWMIRRRDAFGSEGVMGAIRLRNALWFDALGPADGDRRVRRIYWNVIRVYLESAGRRKARRRPSCTALN